MSDAHKGRKRSFAHVKGNWPSFVHINLPACPQLVELTKAARKALEEAPVLDHTEGEDSEAIKANRDCETKALEEKIHDIEDPHISLSRTFVLRYHQIQPFVADLRRQLSTFPRYVLDSEKKPVSKEPVQIKPVQIEPVQSWQYANRQKLTRGFRFEVSLEGVELFENDENTRIFGSALVNVGQDILCQLIGRVDDVLREYDLEPYYENPRPHASLAWRLGARKRTVLVDYSDSDEENERETRVEVFVDRLFLTAGDRVETVMLSAEQK